MNSANIQAILFDLGGVLVEWDGIQPLLDLSGGRLTPDEARLFWLNSPAVRQFETGLCSEQEFAREAVKELGTDLDPEEFITRFTSWDRGPLPGAKVLVDRLKKQFPLYCLSNNNPVHWTLPHIQELTSAFAARFVSFEMGLMKPDPAAFEYVAERIAEPMGQVLFFDDNPECVEAAVEVGFMAREVHGVAEVEKVLSQFAVV
jgi:putative hydrolase of the HAD superfamily